jgi:hypothetical protein
VRIKGGNVYDDSFLQCDKLRRVIVAWYYRYAGSTARLAGAGSWASSNRSGHVGGWRRKIAEFGKSLAPFGSQIARGQNMVLINSTSIRVKDRSGLEQKANGHACSYDEKYTKDRSSRSPVLDSLS